MSEIGPLHEAHLLDGQDARIPLDLAAGCTTIVAVGGATLADVDAALVDPAGARLARGASHTSEATIRACVEAAGTYTLLVRSVQGAGPLLISTWSGGAPIETPAGAARGLETNRGLGTCDAPLLLSAGDFNGSTTHGARENESKGCPNTGAAEIVYKLDLASREKVTLAVETVGHFDSVLYVRKEDCADSDAEVACNDDASPPGGGSVDQRHSKVEQVLEAGTYYVFVDGYNSGGTGTFKLHVELADVPPLAEVCSKASPLAEGTPVNGTTDDTFDEGEATCGDGAHGPDTLYSFEVRRRSRVRLVEHSDDFPPVVHLRARCAEPDSAVGCSESGASDHEAAFLGLLDPGKYMVFADSSQRDASGKFLLTAETSPELGSGVRGERCADAIPLSKTELTVSGDTFAARDDVAGQCGGTGAPDMVYRLEVSSRTRLTAHVTHEEGTHLLILMRACGDAKSELACGKSIDRVLGPGSYFLAVDGNSPSSFGAFTFDWNTHDTHAEDVACRAPPRLREGETISGTTLGNAVDKFTPSCASEDATGGAPDAVYSFVVPTRKRVRLHLHGAQWGSVLSVRRTCVQSDGAALNTGEIECHAEETPDLDFDQTLNAGTYYVVVDGKDPSSSGAFTLEWRGVH